MKCMKKNLTKIKILVAIPTFNRADSVSTLSIFPDGHLIVHSSQIDDYKQFYPQANIIEYTKPEGNIPRKKNFVLDKAKEMGYDAVFFIDDDYDMLYFNGSGKTKKITDPAHIYQVIESHAVLARDLNAPLFTFHNIPDIRRYAKNKPFTFFTTFKRGNFGVLVDSKLRFDERFVLNEDVDIGLQALLHYRKILSDDRYAFKLKKVMGSAGGLANFRNGEREREYLELLKQKWGYDRFKDNGRVWAKRLSNYSVSVVNPFK